jgi:hypothetical protein
MSMEAVDLSTLVEDFELLTPPRPLVWPWVAGGLLLVLVAGLGWMRRRRLAAAVPVPPEPEEVLREDLRGVKRDWLEGGDPIPYLAGVQSALRRYTQARFGVPARALTRGELSARWEETGLEPAALAELDAVFEVCDQGKYAGGRMHAQDRRLLLAMAYRWARSVRPCPEENVEVPDDC